jgi:hypothetical protein
MKLKAPPGVGDPCVAGVAILSRDGIYEVEAKIGAQSYPAQEIDLA